MGDEVPEGAFSAVRVWEIMPVAKVLVIEGILSELSCTIEV
ncbi:hypothetical protein HMPREF0044_1376 [Gleimia coleocanis DSM 15436]|uniref:Uncharacterized protein n=1 Tax=Gleimia coleocanis DSM 15436 TaxID=525245 RepID=C0W1T6_9ACTO|nr:hypothetical protein HMPREF0044_1376 [Gleimia coleocanis DSM 15436]